MSICDLVTSAWRCSTGLEERRRIELGQDLALLDLAVEVGIEFGDDAGDLAADLDGGHRRQGPRGARGRGDVAAAHRVRAVLFALVVPAAPQEEQADQNHSDHSDGGEEKAALLVVVLEWFHIWSERLIPVEASRIASDLLGLYIFRTNRSPEEGSAGRVPGPDVQAHDLSTQPTPEWRMIRTYRSRRLDSVKAPRRLSGHPVPVRQMG